MRIVVGFKVTPDYEALRPADWARAAAGDAATRAEATRYVRRVLNVFDEAALELSLRLRDARAAARSETSLAALLRSPGARLIRFSRPCRRLASSAPASRPA